MNATEFRTALSTLAWSLTRATTELCCARSTICRYLNGKRGIPALVVKHVEQALAKQRRSIAAKNRPKLCDECGIYPADLPSRLCVGCDAYRDHTGQI